MPTENSTYGEMWINGKKILDKVYPYICENGFWFRNHSNNYGGGPHFEINIRPSQFSKALATIKPQEPILSLSNENLGHIDELSGYAAAGDNSYRRIIESVTLKIARSQNCSNIDISGEAGALKTSPLSSYLVPGGGPISFRISFAVRDSELSASFKEPIGLEAMRAYISSTPSKPMD